MKKRIILGLSLMFCLVSVAVAEEINPQNFKQLSSLYPYNEGSPYISGNLVVWAGAKPSAISSLSHVMLYDLTNGREIQITNNNFPNSSPAVDPDLKLIVYLSARDGMHGIYLCEYNPGNGTCPEIKLLEDANYKYYLEIDGNRIVWVEYSATAPFRKIYACDYDFAGRCPKQLVSEGQSISRPNLEGNLLLWEDRTNYDGGTETEHLFLRDFTTGNTYDLDKGDNMIGDMPGLDGNTIFWARQKFNTALQRWERVLARCQYTPGAANVCPMLEIDTKMGKATLYAPASPSVSGKRVVYRNDLDRDPAESVPINTDIYHYNLETGEILRVTTETSSQHMPMVSGNRLVWREARPDGLFIRLYEFKLPNNPPVLDAIGNKTALDGELLSFAVGGSDLDGQGLSFSHPLIQDLPSGASFTTTLNQAGRVEGRFSWTPGAGQSGSHYVLFEVSDGELFNSELITINVIRRLYCGDGIVSAELNEICDSNNQSCVTASGYPGMKSCNSQCSGFDICLSNESCGDGIKNGGEECDGLAGVGAHQECSASCVLINLPYCGDGIKNGVEQCDGISGVGEHQECSSQCVLIDLPCTPQFVVLTKTHTVYTGANLTFNVVAQDANGYNLALKALEALPKNAAFVSKTTTFAPDGSSRIEGTFSWTPGSKQVGKYTLRFDAREAGGSTTTVSDPVLIEVVKPSRTQK